MAARTAASSSMDMRTGRTGGTSVLERRGAAVVMRRHSAVVRKRCGATGGSLARALVRCNGSLAYGPVYPLARGNNRALGTPGTGLGWPEHKKRRLEKWRRASGRGI